MNIKVNENAYTIDNHGRKLV